MCNGFMGKMLSVEVDDSYAKTIDKIIASSKMYSSRSEFLKDSIRKNLQEMTTLSSSLKKIRVESEKLASKATQRGFKGKMPTILQMEKIAKEFLKEKQVQ